MAIGLRNVALDRETIVKAAFELLEGGIAALSTRALAQRLGVKGPSLYWHFGSMRALHDHMAEAMLEEVLPSPDRAISPGALDEWLAAGARGIRHVAMSHRDGARILAGAQPTGASGLSFAAMVARLCGDGFTRDDARASLMALGRYALGWVLDEQIAPGRTAASDADFEFGLQAMLAGLGARARSSPSRLLKKSPSGGR
jgi:TetR/AcrR family tetracycline transcriptional repressor